MVKRLLVLAASLYVVGNSSALLAQSNPTDWTPVFKNWQNGCQNSSQLDNLINKGKNSLPANLKSAIGDKKVMKKNGVVTNVYPFINSTYYGLPLESFGAYQGGEDGVLGSYIVIAANLDTVKKALKAVKFKEDEGMGFAAALSSQGQKSVITCDVSM